jgi:hypothetical protein
MVKRRLGRHRFDGKLIHRDYNRSIRARASFAIASSSRLIAGNGFGVTGSSAVACQSVRNDRDRLP